jgi:RNA polymerase sigma-70 factor (ECF subfamily)
MVTGGSMTEAANTTETAVREVLAGRIDSYSEIVRRHQDEIRRIVAWAMRDPAVTEDLVQQVFVNAYLSLGDYDCGRDFGSWLRTIARNLVRNELRRELREGRKLRLYRERLAERLGGDDASDRHGERLREAMEKCRGELSPQAAEAIELRYVRSMTFEEMAGTLGRTVAATRQMLTRIRQALRRCIEERMA